MTSVHTQTVPQKGRRGVNLRMDKYSGLYLLASFIIIFGIWTPHLFLRMQTVHLLAAQQAVVAMLALAVLTPLAAGAYDLSIGAVINLAAIVVTVLQTTSGLSMWAAIGLTLLMGMGIGAINGFIVVVLKVNSFIATLGTATIIAAFQSIVSGGGQPQPVSGIAWSDLTQATIGGFQVIVIYLVVLAVIMWWFLQHTPAGRYIYAIGSNREAARLSGIRVGAWTFLSLVMAGGLSALAGIFYCSLNGPSLTFGNALLLPAYAAVFLGSTQFLPGKFNVWGTILAIYVLAVGVQGLQYATDVQWLNDMFNGLALIGAVAIAGWRQRNVRSGESRRRAGPPGPAGGAASPGEPDSLAPDAPPPPSHV